MITPRGSFFRSQFSWSPIYAMLAVTVLLCSPEKSYDPPLPPKEKEKDLPPLRPPINNY